MPKRKSLPDFVSYGEASEWLNNHSTSDLYAKPVRFTSSIDLQVVVIGSEENPIEKIPLKKQMSRQIRNIAQRNGLSPGRLVENWLREKIQENLRPSA